MGGYSGKCPICGKWFTDRAALSAHVKSHKGKIMSGYQLYKRWEWMNINHLDTSVDPWEDLSDDEQSVWNFLASELEWKNGSPVTR